MSSSRERQGSDAQGTCDLVYICFFFALVTTFGFDDISVKIIGLLVMTAMALISAGVIA